MNIETVLIMYRNLINYEVTRVLHENIDLWDEAIQESFIRINGNLESILKKKENTGKTIFASSQEMQHEQFYQIGEIFMPRMYLLRNGLPTKRMPKICMKKIPAKKNLVWKWSIA